MSVQLTPAKRRRGRNQSEGNAKGKWKKSVAFTSRNTSLRIPPGSTVFRILCPASKSGNVIGKGGNIISQIRQETGAKVRVEEKVPGCDERIVFIVGSDKENEVSTEPGKGDEEEETKVNEDVDNTNEDGENDENETTVPLEETKSEKSSSSVQKALFFVFKRIVGGESEKEGGDEESTPVVRLLVFSSQVGCLMDNGASFIEQISSESGAQIRILPREELPVCASSFDELLQVSGDVDAVRKALQSISQQLIENPPLDDDYASVNSSGPSSNSFDHPFSRPEAHPRPNYPPFPSQGPPYASGPRDSDIGILGRMNPSQGGVSFRLLCPDEKAGGVIGKGGTVIKSLQQETGCEIKVQERIVGSEDRVIVISGPAHPDERISAPQDAVLRVQSRIVRATPESKEQTVVARVIVSPNQIGCLLGKGGVIMAEMRMLSRAHIQLLEKIQIPSCVGDDEVIQINGELGEVEEALLHITTRLRNHFLGVFPSIDQSSNHAFPDRVPPFPSFMGRREFSPPRIHSSRGPPFNNFNGLPPDEEFRQHGDRPRFMHDMHRPGFPPHISERRPPQGLVEGGGPMGLPDYQGIPQRRMGGFGGGSHPTITNTTVEVVVPRSAVPVIYGDDGGCLKQICEISDATITITDPKPGAQETLIIISGTPEQTHAAQSLIQAFVISESQAP